MWRKWVCHLCELISTPSVFQRFFCESETRNNARCASLIVKKKKDAQGGACLFQFRFSPLFSLAPLSFLTFFSPSINTH